MSLKQDIDQFLEGIKSKLPAEILNSIEKSMEEVKNSVKGNTFLKVGDQAPSFILPNSYNKSIPLNFLLQKGPVIISFYRGSWCPFCNLELRALQSHMSEFKSYKASLVAISPEKANFSDALIEKNQLTFEVLSDIGNKVAKEYGLAFKLGETTKKLMLEVFKNDITQFNGDSSWELPIPGTFVIDQNGTIRLTYAEPRLSKTP